jgi:Domain of unknown function (DUF3598)
MSSQWENFLKNLGEWQGSFTRFSPQGEQLADTPSVVSLVGSDNNRAVRLTVRYLAPDEPPNELVLNYTHIPPQILFFEKGAFTQGSLQWGPWSEFGAEFGLIEGTRRLRLVMLYDRASHFDRVTLIRERLAGTDTPERPPVTVEQLLGTWRGQATTLDRDLRPPQTYATHLQIERQSERRLRQTLKFGDRTLSSTAQIQGSRLLFDEGSLPVQILLFPDGASSNCPLQIQPGFPFVLEVGWLLAPERRQRLIRSYSPKGEWTSATLVEEEKIA